MDAFYPDMAGIRPKLSGPGDKIRDFIICDEKENGFSGFIDLIGVDSQGLTVCLAIAKMVIGIVQEQII
jgi:L-2-hydroxyglutarate oxidase LhgO